MDEIAHKHYQRANHLADIGRWQDAISEAGKCLTYEPNHYQTLCTISRCYFQTEDYKKCLEFAEKAIAADPHQEWAYRLQACTYRRKKKFKQALKAAAEAVKAEPDEILALETLASIQLDLGKIKEAAQTAEKMRSLSPDSFETHEMIGYVALNKRNTEEALTHFERALKIKPDSATALSTYAWTLYSKAERLTAGSKKREMLKNAIEVYELSLQANPNSNSTKEYLKKAVWEYTITDKYTLITILSIALFGFAVFLHSKLGAPIPHFLDISQKSADLVVINILMLIEVHICGLVYGSNHAIKSLSAKTQMFLATEDNRNLTFPFLLLYTVFLFSPVAIFVCRTWIYGFMSIFQITVFDGISVIVASAILTYYLRFVFNKFKQSRFWNWLMKKVERR